MKIFYQTSLENLQNKRWINYSDSVLNPQSPPILTHFKILHIITSLRRSGLGAANEEKETFQNNFLLPVSRNSCISHWEYVNGFIAARNIINQKQSPTTALCRKCKSSEMTWHYPCLVDNQLEIMRYAALTSDQSKSTEKHHLSMLQIIQSFEIFLCSSNSGRRTQGLKAQCFFFSLAVFVKSFEIASLWSVVIVTSHKVSWSEYWCIPPIWSDLHLNNHRINEYCFLS